MTMKLYIAEKASVGKALADALPGTKKREGNFIRCGGDVVAWAAGHLLELWEPEDYDPRFKKWNRDTLLYVPEIWKLKPKSSTKTLLAGLKKLIGGLSKSDVVVHAGDSDREGQLLIDEILEHCGWKGTTKRLRINDVTPGAIREALGRLRDNGEFKGERDAARARLYADWLVGLAMTRHVTFSVRAAGYKTGVLSVGRVQTPTLGLVVARDREIAEFVPSPYYELTAALTLGESRVVKARWRPREDAEDTGCSGQIVDRSFADALARKLDGARGSVTSVTKKRRVLAPPLPYSLPKLQMAASKKYDIIDALVHVQKLYEAGYVTYPRTDCEYLPERRLYEAPKVIEVIRAGCPALAGLTGGVDLLRKSPAWNDAKVAEHHAIIPTARPVPDGALSTSERQLYELICARYALQFLAGFEYEETVVGFEASGEKFEATGRTVVNLGWRGWDNHEARIEKAQEEEGADEDSDEAEAPTAPPVLPSIREGESGEIHATVAEKVTTPPKPFTYHSLLAAMNGVHAYVKDPAIRAKLKEVQGIGTAATQERILATLFARGYVVKRKKQVVTTDLGKLLVDLLRNDAPVSLADPSAAELARFGASALVVPDMTARWETRMDEIQTGAPLGPFVAEVAAMTRAMVSTPLAVPGGIPWMERAAAKSSPFEAPCPAADCTGCATRFTRKKDGKPFWKCGKCGSFFDDAEGKPRLRQG